MLLRARTNPVPGTRVPPFPGLVGASSRAGRIETPGPIVLLAELDTPMGAGIWAHAADSGPRGLRTAVVGTHGPSLGVAATAPTPHSVTMRAVPHRPGAARIANRH